MTDAASPLRAILGGLIVGIALIVCSGCGSIRADDAIGPTRKATDPTFHGPYASEFQTAFEQARTERVRRTLADGVISSQEFSEAQAGVKKCMADSGYTLDYDDRGGMDVGSDEGKYDADFHSRMEPILEACEREHDGDITYLYRETVVNPEKVDDRRAIVKCLLENDLVPKGYSVRDYDRDNGVYSFPFGQFDPKGMACMDDPLGLWAKRQ